MESTRRHASSPPRAAMFFSATWAAVRAPGAAPKVFGAAPGGVAGCADTDHASAAAAKIAFILIGQRGPALATASRGF